MTMENPEFSRTAGNRSIRQKWKALARRGLSRIPYNRRWTLNCVLYTNSGELLRISLGSFEGGDDGAQIGIKLNRGTLQMFRRADLGLLGGSGK